MFSSGEEWRPCPFGYEELYAVSSLGRVLSLRTGKLMRLNGAQHYLRVSLSKDGTTRMLKVHILVCTAFHGARRPGHIAAHGPGGHRDNSAANLSWKTQAENLGPDRRRDGTAGRRVMNLPRARECRVRYDHGRGERIQDLAEEFGISLEHMRLIVTGKRWADAAQEIYA
jgi:hypothetical protein